MTQLDLSRQQAILEASQEMIVTISPSERLLYLNVAGRQMLAIPDQVALEEQPFFVSAFHSATQYRQLKEEVFPALLAGAGRWQGELELLNLSGHKVPVRATIIAHRDEQGQVLWLTGIMRDVSRHKQLETQQRLAMRVFENTIEGIIVTDADARIQQVNQAFCEITGYSALEVIGKTPKILRSELHDHDFYQAMWQSIAQQDRWQGEVWNRRKDGSVFLEWLSINCVRNAQGEIENYISIFHDLTELRAKEAKIEHLASHDPLTGLGNRRLLDERINHAIRHARVYRQGLALLVIDLGHIQLLNESLGYNWCDRFIREQSQRLKLMADPTATLVRIGSDEFALLLESGESTHELSQLAQKIKEALQQEVVLDQHHIVMSPSIGIALYPQDALHAEGLLINAQAALLDAKEVGRDTFRFFDQQMSREARDRLKLEQALRHAILGGGLSLHYQPKIHLLTGQVTGAEALLRWEHPELGALSPAVFIPLAEASGLIVEIGAWVLREACAHLRAWQDQGIACPRIAVNLAVQQLDQAGFAHWLEALLEEYQLSVDDLELEITETSLMKNEKRALTCLAELRAKGFHIALDDFGTGYSSLSYLRKLPLTTLKIDRSFILDMSEDPASLSIVKTIVQLAQNLGLGLVAEGVENAAQAEQLIALGCPLAQGFYFHKPLHQQAFEALLMSTLPV